MALRTVIADADPLARRLLRTVLERAGVVVAAEARDAAEAVELVLRHGPDVALVDGIDAVRAIHGRAPAQPVVVLARDECEQAALAALLAGASGYLSKELEPDALPRALAAVAAGEAAVSRRLTQRLVERFRDPPALRPVKGPLTAREWEIVGLMAPDRTTGEIAYRLVLSPETVRSHVKSIMRKLDVHSRHDAPAAAERLRTAGT